jgi:hypothetical protein
MKRVRRPPENANGDWYGFWNTRPMLHEQKARNGGKGEVNNWPFNITNFSREEGYDLPEDVLKFVSMEILRLLSSSHFRIRFRDHQDRRNFTCTLRLFRVSLFYRNWRSWYWHQV